MDARRWLETDPARAPGWRELFRACMVMTLLLCPPAAAWQSLHFADDCPDDGTRELLEQAHELLFENLDLVWDELDRSDAAERGYLGVSDALREDIAAELVSLRIRCDHSSCPTDEYTVGLGGAIGIGAGGLATPLSKAILCLDGILAWHDDSGIESPVAVLSAALAEGATLLALGASTGDMRALAGSLGGATHNVFLTPDLDVEILSASLERGGLRLLLELENRNSHGADMGQVSVGGVRPNGSFDMELLIDGERVYEFSVSAIGPGDATEFQVYLPAGDSFDPTRAEQLIEVRADPQDTLVEMDEANNHDSVLFSPWVDLAITHFELAGPYESVVLDDTGAVGLAPGGLRRITWDAVCENLSLANGAGLVHIEKAWPEHLGGGRFQQNSSEGAISSVSPGTFLQTWITAEVPEDLAGRSYTVRLALDVREAVLDPDRSNNVVEVRIDEDWFRPDYTVVLDGLDLLEGGDVLLTGRVRNIGPERGGKATLRVENWDGRVFPLSVPPLPVLGEHPFQVLAERDQAAAVLIPGKTYTLAVTVDAPDAVAENNEANNEASVSFRYGVDLSDLLDRTIQREIRRGDLYPLDITVAPWLEDVFGWPPGSLQPGPWLDPSASGPFVPPVEILVGQSALGNMLVLVQQGRDGGLRVRTWRRDEAAAFQAHARQALDAAASALDAEPVPRRPPRRGRRRPPR